MIFYNENDIKTSLWLKELVIQNHIPHGIVDTRDIKELTFKDPEETSHFFCWNWRLAFSFKISELAKKRTCMDRIMSMSTV